MTRVVPSYLEQATFKEATPGSKFGLYLDVWGDNLRKSDAQIAPSLKEVVVVPEHAQRLIAALHLRQQALANALPQGDRLSLIGKAVAPFVTGLGNEHSLENGFAFLNPYGMPYLAGSGVKGVVRRAAEELASGEWGKSDWTPADVWCLFGLDGEEWGETSDWNGRNVTHDDVATFMVPFAQRRDEAHSKLSSLAKTSALLAEAGNSPAVFRDCRGELHCRGLLSFWDTIPDCGEQLKVEIMTAHHTAYLMGTGSPHDSEGPNPIRFLSVGPGSTFNFIVTCDAARMQRLWSALSGRWQALLQSAFEHAFDWLGFGAKTRVGYGAMGVDLRAMEDRDERIKEEVRKEREKQMSAEQLAINKFRERYELELGKAFVPSGDFADRRNRFIKTVAEWSNESDRRAAVEVLLQSTKTHASPDKKKRRELEERIQGLVQYPT